MFLFFFTVLGLFLGSFANVVSLRLQQKMSGIIAGRSECPKCKTLLKWYDNIPLISWGILLRGKCRSCKEPISWQYPAVELFFGFLFFLVAFFTPPEEWFLLLWRGGILFFLGILIISDIRYMNLPDEVSFPMMRFLLLCSFADILFLHTHLVPHIYTSLLGAGIIYGFFSLQVLLPGIITGIQQHRFYPIRQSFFSVLLFPFWVLFSCFFLGKTFEKICYKNQEKQEEDIPSWIGGGDLRLAIIIGLTLGWKVGLATVCIAYCAGTLFSLPLLLLKKKSPTSYIPFGPFLGWGLIVCLFFGNALIDWYIRFVF